MITTRGDTATITVAISFSKKDTQEEGWEAKKQKIVAGVLPEFYRQITEVEDRAVHEADVRERIKGTIGR